MVFRNNQYHFVEEYDDNGVVAMNISTIPIDSVTGGGNGNNDTIRSNPAPIFSNMYYIHTDHLGSYCAITDASKKLIQRNYFDPWGNFKLIHKSFGGRDGDTTIIIMDTASMYYPHDSLGSSTIPNMNFTLTDRGFTGHEHYPYFKIINMNGRLYDPTIGRMFSPDKFVANSSFTQDFNRYSYCRNNPLMYTDPTGNKMKWWGWLLLGFGLLDPVTATATVITAGTTVASMAATTAISTYPLTFLTTLPFLPYNGNSGDMDRVRNAYRINNGFFVTDKNKSFFGRVWQFVSRNSWEVLQTIGGYAYSQGRNLGGKVDHVEYWGGATFVISENVEDMKGWLGVSLSNYINVKLEGEFNRDYPGGWIYGEDGLFLHEYGHSLQSHNWGFAYLFGVGIPSAVARDGRYTWTELKANNRVFKYLKKYGLLDNWDDYEDEYPLEKKE